MSAPRRGRPGKRRVRGKPWPSDNAGAEVRGRSSVCSHRLVLYPSAGAARTAAKAIRVKDPAGVRLRPRECADLPGMFHLCELAAPVAAGEVNAETYYAGLAELARYNERKRKHHA